MKDNLRDRLVETLVNKELDKVPGKKTDSAKIISLIKENNIEIFLNQFRDPIITSLESKFIALPIKSRKAEFLIGKLFWDRYKKPPSKKAIDEAINTLCGMAHYNNPQIKEVYNRIGKVDNVIYYDLGDDQCVIKIDSEGWHKEIECPIFFQRYNHQKKQVMPQKGGDLKSIINHINISDENNQLLFLTHLVTCFVPDIPRASLAISGPPGSAKSTLLKMVRSIVDPSQTPMITHAPNSKELIQAASHHYFVIFDNLSSLPTWLSDTICRLVTGDAFSKRELYTNDEDILYSFKRAVGVCGINLVATKSDLLSRSLIITLDLIDKTQRKEEKAVLNNFEENKPQILGAIFDCLSYCLNTASTLELNSLPRMADHFRYSATAAQFLDYTIEELEQASKNNTANQNEEAIGASSVAQVVLEFMSNQDSWAGTSSELFSELEDVAEKLKLKNAIPKSPNWLVRRIMEVEINLLDSDIKVKKGRKSKANTIELTNVNSKQEIDPNYPSSIETSNGSMEAMGVSF